VSDSPTPGIGQMLANSNAPIEIPVGVRVWKVAYPDQDAKDRLEKLVAKAALNEVRRLKGVLDAAEYAELFSEATRALPECRTWRAGWQRYVFDPAYAHLFLWSLLQAHHPNATERDVIGLMKEVPEEVTAALVQVIPDFFRVLLSGLDLTPEQAETVEAAMATIRERLTPTPASTST
jgi:hypothetical protein